MTKSGVALRHAFVRAYRPYVEAKVAVLRDDEISGLSESISEGEAWLDQALSELLDLPFAQQPRGPLEVFQEALGFLTPALTAAGVESVVRDEVTSNALPGDLYHLAPASSMEVGEEAWHAHLAWGATKAAALAVPHSASADEPGPLLVGVVSRNLMDSPKLSNALVAAGHEVSQIRQSVLPSNLDVLIVDLEHPSAEAVLQAASGLAVLSIAYGPHADDSLMERGAIWGARHVVARSEVLRDPAAFAKGLER